MPPLFVEKIFGTVMPLFFSQPTDKDMAYSKVDVADTITVKSSAFENGTVIPWKYGGPGDGEDTCPPLTVSNLPEGTKSLVVIVEDRDVPMPSPITHFVAYNIDPKTTEFKEGYFNNTSTVDGTTTLGGNIHGKQEYIAPRPLVNHGPHAYWYQVFALKEDTKLEPKLKLNKVMEVVKSKALAKGVLEGFFERTDAKHKM